VSQDQLVARSLDVIALAVVGRSDATETNRPGVVETDFERSFRAVFEDQFASLRRYLDRLTGDADLAVDLAQETFVRLFQRGSMPANPRGWLAAVASNLFRDERRRARRRATLMIERAPELAMSTTPPLPDVQVTAADEKQRVRVALDTLPLRDRQLLLLRFEDYSYRELAVAVDVAESSVGTLLARAMRAFRAALSADDPSGADSQ
jgi:RNA polymerase sigma-70 factor, ECF subfamily